MNKIKCQEDDKMNYLEQFTFGEANKLMSGFSHLTGEHVYKRRHEKLEETNGDHEVIANVFIKRALE